MKVKCVRNISPITGEEIFSNEWLTVGKIYVVLSLVVRVGVDIQFRLLGNDNQIPALFDSKQFVVVSSVISSNWVIKIDHDCLQLSPSKWLKKGFWENYFDDDLESVRDFRNELHIILSEANG